MLRINTTLGTNAQRKRLHLLRMKPPKLFCRAENAADAAATEPGYIMMLGASNSTHGSA
jgi:hypothetical protein